MIDTEVLLQRRITPETEVVPHRFLYEWDGKPCFARGELVALTGKAKSGKTYMASILMALADQSPLMGISRCRNDPGNDTLSVLWLGTELQNKSFETYECTKASDTHLITVRQTATRKYDITAKLTFSVDNNGLPVCCSGVTHVEDMSQSRGENNFTPIYRFSPLNSAYLTPEGKIDQCKLFSYILQNGKRMAWKQLQAVTMKVAGITSFSFADTLIKEALSKQLIRQTDIDNRNLYELATPQTEIF